MVSQQTPHELSDILLHRREVQARCGLSKTTIYRLIKDGEFPEPVRVGAKAVRWSRAKIEAWVESRPIGTRIHIQRQQRRQRRRTPA